MAKQLRFTDFDGSEFDDKHRCNCVMQCLIQALFSLADSSGMFLQPPFIAGVAPPVTIHR